MRVRHTQAALGALVVDGGEGLADLRDAVGDPHPDLHELMGTALAPWGGGWGAGGDGKPKIRFRDEGGEISCMGIS